MRRSLIVCALLAIACLLPACLETREAILGRYDAPRDTFCFLNLYQRIGGERPADFDYLAELYANRAHLLTPPIPNILGKTSFLRLSPHEYATLGLGERKSPDVEKTDLPLDQVTVKPGKFFLRGADALCYYDQVEVPGSFVDAMITQYNSSATAELARDISNELDRRRDGGQSFTWADVRAADAGAAQDPNAAKASPLTAASADTLKRVREGCLDGSLALKRSKSVFHLAIPATDEDIKEVTATLAGMKNKLAEQIKAPDHDKDLEAQLSLLSVIEIKPVTPGKVELSVEAVKLFAQLPKIFAPLAELEAPASDEQSQKFKNAVSAIRGKNIPIDEKLTVDEVLQKFGAGGLPGEKTDVKVPAGKGLVDRP